jgi:hypothetical protein
MQQHLTQLEVKIRLRIALDSRIAFLYFELRNAREVLWSQ